MTFHVWCFTQKCPNTPDCPITLNCILLTSYLGQIKEAARKKSRFLFSYLLFGSLTNPMLITASLQFKPKFVSLSPVKQLVGFELRLLWFNCNTLTHCNLFTSFSVICFSSWFQKITSKLAKLSICLICQSHQYMIYKISL